MNKLYIALMAAIGFLAIPVHAQDSAPNSEMQNKGPMTQQDEMHKDGMKKDHATKTKKSKHHKAKSNDEMMKKDDMKKKDDMMKKDNMMKKEDGTMEK